MLFIREYSRNSNWLLAYSQDTTAILLLPPPPPPGLSLPEFYLLILFYETDPERTQPFACCIFSRETSCCFSTCCYLYHMDTSPEEIYSSELLPVLCNAINQWIVEKRDDVGAGGWTICGSLNLTFHINFRLYYNLADGKFYSNYCATDPSKCLPLERR